VQNAISTASISTTTQVASPVNLTTASTQNQVLTGSLAYTVRLPDATTLVVGRSFIININTSATAYTGTINNFTGTALVSNGQQGSIFQCILLTNSTSDGTWDIHSFLPKGANFGSSGLVYQGNLTFTGSGTSVISQSGSGTLQISAPTLTGVPLCPTATVGTNTTQVASCQFVQTAVSGATAPPINSVLASGNTATGKTLVISDGGTNNITTAPTSLTATASTGTNAMTSAGNTITNSSTGNTNVATVSSDTITAGTNNTVQNATGFTATSSTGNTVHNASGLTATVGNSNTSIIASGITATNSGGNTLLQAGGVVATQGSNNVVLDSGRVICTSAGGQFNTMTSSSYKVENGTDNIQITPTTLTATTSAGTNVMIGASDTITNGTNNTVQNATGFTATTSAGTNAMIGASNTITAGANATTFTSTGFTATVSGSNQIVANASTPNLTVGAGSNTSSVGNGILTLNSTGSGYTNAPQVNLQSNNNTAGSTVGVPSMSYYKAGRNAVADDLITTHHFYARNYAGTKTEFARVEVAVRNTGAGNDDGSIGFLGLINGVQTEFFRLNGADSENNMFLNLDMNGNSVKTTAGNITIDASTSAGTGSIIETLKAGGNLIINNLPTSSAGLPTNAVWRNGNVLNIV
jgi:hypothetical protein